MFIPTTAYTSGVITLQISATTQNYNVLSQVTAVLGGAPVDPVEVVIEIAAGVIVGATSTGVYALNAGGLPSGSTLEIVMGQGSYIVGAGGKGGNGTSVTGSNAQSGGTGGTALYNPLVTTITGEGTGAFIGGGGGGGGGGGATDGLPSISGGGGGGGAGYTAGAGGIGASPYCSASYHNGTAGSLTGGGTGGNGSAFDYCTSTSTNRGGNGGGLGAAGAAGSWSNTGDPDNRANGAGGAGGKWANTAGLGLTSAFNITTYGSSS